MRSFKLHDNTGKSVACVAFGRQTDSTAMVSGNEVILFFAQSLAGLQGYNGALWMFDACHIAWLRQDCFIPPEKVVIELKA